MDRQLAVEVRDSVLNPFDTSSARKAHFRESGDTVFYKVWLYLEGKDLTFVERVTYLLHRTFPVPERVVRRTEDNPNCQLVIWTWGLFPVHVSIEDVYGNEYKMVHDLTYGKELDVLRDDQFQEE